MENLKYFAQAMSIIQLEKNNASQWHHAFDHLCSISRLEAYFLLSQFPGLIVNPPVSPSEDEAIAWTAAEIEYSAKAAWLLSWRTDRKDPRLIHPERFEFPINCWREYQTRAKLSELLFDMIDAFGDHLAKAEIDRIEKLNQIPPAFEQLKPCAGLLWLLSEAAECRSKLSPQVGNQTIDEAYCQAKSYRDGNLAPLDNPKFIAPLTPHEVEVIFDRSDVFDFSLDSFNLIMINNCRHLANIDRQFKGTFWKPYWSVQKSVYSTAKKQSYKTVPWVKTSSPKPKRSRKKSR